MTGRGHVRIASHTAVSSSPSRPGDFYSDRRRGTLPAGGVVGLSMLRPTPSGTWLPSYIPESTSTLSVLLLLCSVAQSTTGGYDGSMLNGLNMLPSYADYFGLTSATRGLNTASIFIGGFFGPVAGGVMSDSLGRRPALFWASVITVAGVALQTAARNVAMFVVGRIVLGFGGGISYVAAPVYLSETFSSRWRPWGVGVCIPRPRPPVEAPGSTLADARPKLLNNFYYVGALVAAGVTLATGRWDSTWAWRCPSLLQSVFSLVCVLVLPFVPESPRWLVRQDRYEDARLVVAQTNADGDVADPVASAVYREILDTLEREKKRARAMSPVEIARNPVARRRVLVGASAGPFSCVAGNVIASYYLGSELTTAGVTSPSDQLKANVVLNVWCLACCLAGTQLAASWGRKSTALVSQALLTACLFVIGGLSKMYADDPGGAPQSLVYGDVAVMFLFQGFYSVAWTPLLPLYPPEVMDYPTRANGVALSAFTSNGLAMLLVFVMPIGLDTIGWRMYMIKGSWDVITFLLIAVFWVETKGKTLEEMDAIFEPEKQPRSSVPAVEDARPRPGGGREQDEV
ncbi:Major facilitator superfamily domain, general substrate transporter [Metarhizium album ARSEF 1941]|uniref:Major facilitator superfamily domain, general substrate transporter n=1 Tax=Metarhizium album (strain ARSEF 1941) TaxID=1081103 RepID=A0A0B2WLJ4_METAS|nr:Major facilitator superfamily domain, general substrate transporter [Metarhizium album ARSEF 1941]KHN94347.1 Major facilitator superfamily domain, general substrate transporter [Metarhizium album ARSEF 1941]